MCCEVRRSEGTLGADMSQLAAGMSHRLPWCPWSNWRGVLGAQANLAWWLLELALLEHFLQLQTLDNMDKSCSDESPFGKIDSEFYP